MPEAAMAQSGTEAQYRDLVRLAYFVLPGKGKRFYRLAVAQRIVDGVVGRPGRGGAERRRTRVLKRAMRPSWRLRVGLGPWLRALPAKLPDAALTGALAKLEPPVRVAYVLRHVEGLPRYAVRDQLVALRVRDPWPVIDAADEADLPGADEPAPFEPAPVRIRRRPVLPLAAATLTTALIGALIVTESGGGFVGGTRSASARNLRLIEAAPDAWRKAGAGRGLDAWPARGDLAGDRSFTGRALHAWASADHADLDGRSAQLLYAGHVDGTPVAVLRHDDRIARYSGTSTATLQAFAAGTDASAPIPLGGDRYLLAPWDTTAKTTAGRKVIVTGGVTGPVTTRTRCARGPLLDLSGAAGSRTVGDLGGPRPVVLTYHSPAYHPAATAAAATTAAAPVPATAATPTTSPKPTTSPTPTTSATSTSTTSLTPTPTSSSKAKAKSTPTATSTPAAKSTPKPAASATTAPAATTVQLPTSGVHLWERLGCLLPQPARPVTEAMAWEFWSGNLPADAGRAQWVCTRMTFAGGGTAAQSDLLEKSDQQTTGWCDERKPVSGAWWQSPADKWYYLGAASTGLTPHATGPFSKSKVTKRLLVAPATKPKTKPTAPVTLTADAR
ncbi:hypothetical protein J4573_42075 [Actinomadura barringtoniae]|uniref:Uncharacterized protein n=1 Tax=Actinomadura barringtoniae TaxID=1427535 RepID=A0A939PK20_9ACTN|nr:hypothetical protein [Actinomadura barringtoniae]MBO2453737.1 hypothetical protein [Actinomadura barringtoniae]